MEKENQTIQAESGYIKLYKNQTSKGVVTYNWEIKMQDNKEAETYKKLIQDMEELNNLMLNKFIGGEI